MIDPTSEARARGGEHHTVAGSFEVDAPAPITMLAEVRAANGRVHRARI